MKEQLKVLHVITRSVWAGAQQNCYDIVTGLDKDTYSIEVACAPNGELVDRLRQSSIMVHEITHLRRDISPLNDLRTLASLYQLIRAKDYDIVHCHCGKAGLLGRIAAKIAGSPVIIFTAHGFIFHLFMNRLLRDFYEFLEKVASRYSTSMVIAVSKMDAEDVVARSIILSRKISVVYCGRDLSRFNYEEVKISASEKKRQLGIDLEFPVVGMVARLSLQKAPEFFLESARYVVDRIPNARFVLVGDGPLRCQLEDHTKKLDLTGKVIFLGDRDDVPELLKMMDVFVLSSLWEGLPLSIIEAMAMKRAVVATAVNGSVEIVEDGKTGLLVEPKKPREMADRIIELLENPRLRIEMGNAGRERVESDFNMDRMLRKISDLYQSLYCKAKKSSQKEWK